MAVTSFLAYDITQNGEFMRIFHFEITINVTLFKKLRDIMAHKVIVPQKKIMSQSFLNSGTLVILGNQVLLCTVVVCCCLLLGVLVCCCVLEGCGGLLVAVLCEQVFRGRRLAGRAPPPPP